MSLRQPIPSYINLEEFRTQKCTLRILVATNLCCASFGPHCCTMRQASAAIRKWFIVRDGEAPRRNLADEIPADNLQEFVMEINKHLEVMHLAIQKSVQEDSANDIHCFVLVNSLNSDATRMFSTFTLQELALFRSIIEEVVNSDDGEILETDAINLATTLEPRMKIADSEEAIEHLVLDKWLLRHSMDEHTISLSALTTSELQPYLQDLYPELAQKCFFCKILTFKGYRCTKCTTRVHRKCGKNFWAHKGAQSVLCPDPLCKEQWPNVEQTLKMKRQKVYDDEDATR
nr:non-structural maintenance of chromosomes element 1 homolog [Cherax quadricarinatus]